MKTRTSGIDSDHLKRLRQAAMEAASRAYAPYSKFYVGAALLFDDGSVFTGCNVENASYGLTSCAERNALFRAISERGAGPRIRAIVVVNRNGAPSAPCGACRQVMSEFVTQEAVVDFPGTSGPETKPFAAIFPNSFALEQQP
jgi:cytidine deaminase